MEPDDRPGGITFDNLELAHQRIFRVLNAADQLVTLLKYRDSGFGFGKPYRFDEHRLVILNARGDVGWSDELDMFASAVLHYTSPVKSFLDGAGHRWYSPTTWHSVAADVIDVLANHAKAAWPRREIATEFKKLTEDQANVWMDKELDTFGQAFEKYLADVPLEALGKERARWQVVRELRSPLGAIDPNTLKSGEAITPVGAVPQKSGKPKQIRRTATDIMVELSEYAKRNGSLPATVKGVADILRMDEGNLSRWIKKSAEIRALLASHSVAP